MSAYLTYANRCKESTTSTGTGIITLNGVASGAFKSISSRVPIGGMFPYCIVGQTGSEWEVGRGTLLTSTTFSRDIVEESSNSDALVNFSAGTKDVFITHPASISHDILTLGQGLAARNGLAMP